jgi:hypothetical protein
VTFSPTRLAFGLALVVLPTSLGACAPVGDSTGSLSIPSPNPSAPPRLTDAEVDALYQDYLGGGLIDTGDAYCDLTIVGDHLEIENWNLTDAFNRQTSRLNADPTDEGAFADLEETALAMRDTGQVRDLHYRNARSTVDDPEVLAAYETVIAANASGTIGLAETVLAAPDAATLAVALTAALNDPVLVRLGDEQGSAWDVINTYRAVRCNTMGE